MLFMFVMDLHFSYLLDRSIYPTLESHLDLGNDLRKTPASVCGIYLLDGTEYFEYDLEFKDACNVRTFIRYNILLEMD